MGLLDALRDKSFWNDVGSNARDVVQGASNSAASNVSAPIDGLSSTPWGVKTCFLQGRRLKRLQNAIQRKN